MVSVTVFAVANKPPPFARKILPLTIDVSSDATVGDVKAKIAQKIPKFYASRQKITLKNEKKALGDEIKLSDVGLGNGSDLEVKDLGPQLSWRLVYIIEYLGPMLIHPLFYFFPQLLYGKAVVHSELQKYIFTFVMLHYAKRELETLFVHRFSHGTMPARNIFKNSFHYHILGGLFIAVDVYRGKYSADSAFIKGSVMEDERFLWTCTGLWTFFELSNLSTHLTLRNLRPTGTKKRGIPKGYGFGLVSCPNYMFEVLGWIVVCVMSRSWTACFFTAVGAGQMAIWALGKHRNYRKEFGKEYPRGRKAMFPFIL
ncbi:3-oxo-5-alpha-steroid 4-dehydrogenase-domain-containing protein [Armillaria fumosa]|nr:3-oxo-5-alpha-steroid 4-dehydrogenase-domain-containing protein [Armillaria fumosa]